MAKSGKHYPGGEEEHLPPDDEPEVEQHDEVEQPDAGVGELEPPDQGIRHRGIPDPPPVDAPIPPQDIKDEGGEPKKGDV